jgi:hypothetical protein
MMWSSNLSHHCSGVALVDTNSMNPLLLQSLFNIASRWQILGKFVCVDVIM